MNKRILVMLNLISFFLSILLSTSYAETEKLTTENIISKLLDAYGGEENWINIKGYTMSCKVNNPVIDRIDSLTGFVLLPDKVKLIIERTEEGEIMPTLQIVYNKGKTKSFIDGKEIEDGPDLSAGRQLFRQFMIDKRPLAILTLKNNASSMKILGEEEVKERNCYTLGFKNRFGNEERYSIDKETFYLVKIQVTDGLTFLEQYFRNHERFGNIFIPVERESYRDGKLIQKSYDWKIDFRLPDENIFELNESEPVE